MMLVRLLALILFLILFADNHAFSCDIRPFPDYPDHIISNGGIGPNGWIEYVKMYSTPALASAAAYLPNSCRSSAIVFFDGGEGNCYMYDNNSCPASLHSWKFFCYCKDGSGDSDGDGLPDSTDPCPDNPNPDCTDPHGDSDGDGTPDDQDPCPNNPNPDCTDPGGDADGDGTPDDQDPCPYNPDPNCKDPDDPPDPGDLPDIPDEIPVGDCVFDLRSFKEWLNTGSAFPFNLLFRFIVIVRPLFDLTPEPPVFEINLDFSSYNGRYPYIPSTLNFRWDFTPYDTYAKLIRSALILSIIIFVVSYGLNSSKERP